MKTYSFYIVVLISLFFCLSCEEPSNTNGTNSGSATDNPVPESKPDAPPLKKANNCKSSAKTIEDNELFLPKEGIWLTIAADSTTTDVDFGDSYRILEVYNTANCERIFRQTLPINNSPDFPYYIFAESYNTASRVICMPAFGWVYCYDVAAKKLLPELVPKYLSPREGVDAQSGMPLGLASEGMHLFGYARDLGAYAFDLSKKEGPKALLPLAETSQGGTSLFAIGDGKGNFQLLLAYFDQNQQQLELQKLFDTPRPVIPTVSKRAANNRYVVLKEKQANGRQLHVAIDMEDKRMLVLPEDIAQQSVQQILKWIRQPQ